MYLTLPNDHGQSEEQNLLQWNRGIILQQEDNLSEDQYPFVISFYIILK